MRTPSIALVAVAMLCVQAGAADAYEVSLIPTTPQLGNVGDIVSFDVFLDSQGDIGLNSLSVGITFDPTSVAYRPDLSGSNSDYPMYVTAAGKYPPTWLQPFPFDGNPCTLEDRICANPPAESGGTLPPIGGQVNIEFVTYNYPVGLLAAEDWLTGTTQVQLATVSFQIMGAAVSAGAFGFGLGNRATAFGFSAGPDAIDITDQIIVTGDATMGWVPEPGTALLVGLGLAGLGAARRRHA